MKSMRKSIVVVIALILLSASAFIFSNYTSGSTSNLNVSRGLGSNFNTSIPNGLVHIIALKISNSESVHTPAPFQQLMNFDSAKYSKYEAPNLQNIVFFNSDLEVIPSWLESGASKYSIQTYYWLSLARGISGDSYITIFMGFAKETTNLFNGKTIGEAPQLSHRYGEFDNGARVFNYYDNFAGRSLSSNWEKTYSSDVRVWNGLYLSSDFESSGIHTKLSTNGSQVIETRATELKGPQDFYFGLSSDKPFGGQGGHNFDNGYYAGWSFGSPNWHWSLGYVLNTTSYDKAVVDYHVTFDVQHIYSLAWAGSTLANMEDYVTLGGAHSGYVFRSANYVGIFTYSGGPHLTIGLWKFSWVRLRSAPPDNVMPVVSIE